MKRTKTWKRLVVWYMALAIIISIMPMSVMASQEDEPPAAVQENRDDSTPPPAESGLVRDEAKPLSSENTQTVGEALAPPSENTQAVGEALSPPSDNIRGVVGEVADTNGMAEASAEAMDSEGGSQGVVAGSAVAAFGTMTLSEYDDPMLPPVETVYQVQYDLGQGHYLAETSPKAVDNGNYLAGEKTAVCVAEAVLEGTRQLTGWTLNGRPYSFGQEYVIDPADANQDHAIVFQAVYGEPAEQFTSVYTLYGKTGETIASITLQTDYNNSNLYTALPANAFAEYGYTVVQWQGKTEQMTPDRVVPGGTFEAKGNKAELHAYAQQGDAIENTWTVKFVTDGNGSFADGSSSVSKELIPHKTPWGTASINAPTPMDNNGYKFDHWTVDVTYLNDDPNLNGGQMITSDVTYTAHFTKVRSSRAANISVTINIVPTSKPWNEEDPTFSATIDLHESNPDFDAIQSALSLGRVDKSNVMGPYDITVLNLDALKIQFPEYTFQVNPGTLTITSVFFDLGQLQVASKYKIFGEDDPDYELSGWPANINQSDFDVTFNRTDATYVDGKLTYSPGENKGDHRTVAASVTAKEPTKYSFTNPTTQEVTNVQPGLLTIFSKEITVTARDMKLHVGDPVPKPEELYALFTYSGFAFGQTETTVIEKRGTISVTYAPSKPAGTYWAHLGIPVQNKMGEQDNYVICGRNAYIYVDTEEITFSNLTLAAQKTYGTTDPTDAEYAAALQNWPTDIVGEVGENFTVSFTRADKPDPFAAGPGEDVGPHKVAIKVTAVEGSPYTIKAGTGTKSGTLTIVPANLTLVMPAIKLPMNSDVPAITHGTESNNYHYKGYAFGQSAGDVFSQMATAGTSYQKGDPAKSYPIYCNDNYKMFKNSKGNNNYRLIKNTGSLIIEPEGVQQSLLGSLTDLEKVYGDPEPDSDGFNKAFTWSKSLPKNVNPEHFTVSVTRAAGQDVNDYQMTATITPKAGYENSYTLDKTPITANFKITPKDLTATLLPQTIDFGTLPAPFEHGTHFSYSGLIPADEGKTLTELGITPGIVSIGGGFSMTEPYSNASSSYPMALSEGAAKNYSVPSTTSTLTVMPRAIDVSTLQVRNQTKTYGSEDPENSLMDWPATLPPKEQFDISFNRDTGQDVNGGQGYAIYATLTPKAAYANGYTVTGFVQSGTLTIDKLPVLIRPVPSGKPYGTVADPTLSASEAYGAGHNQPRPSASYPLEPLQYTVKRDAGENVGTYRMYIDPPQGANDLGTTNPNYDVTTAELTGRQDGEGFTIVPNGSLLVNMPDITRVYGEPDVTDLASQATIIGLQDNDSLHLTVSRTAGRNVGSYAYQISWQENPTYTEVKLGSVGSYTITPAPLTLIAFDEVMDAGAALPTFRAYVGPNTSLQNGDQRLLYAVYVETDGSTAGSYPIMIHLGENPNYNITTANGTLTVNSVATLPLSPPETTPPVTPPTPAPTAPAAPPAPVDPAVAAPPAPAALAAAVPAPAAEAPAVNLPNNETPLAAPPANNTTNLEDSPTPLAGLASWALVNLLLAIATVLFAVVLIAGYFMGRRKNEENKAEAEDQQNVPNEQNEQNEPYKQNELRRKGLPRLISILVAAASVLLFLLTEDMRNPMVLLDQWTLWMAIIALVQVGVAVVAKKTNKKREEDDANAQHA